MNCACNSWKSGVKTVSISTDNVTAKELLLPPERTPLLATDALFQEALEIMNRMRLGMVCVVDDDRNLQGVITDGDVRRALLRFQGPSGALFSKDALDFAIRDPIVISGETTASDALRLMGEKQVWDLPVVDSGRRLLGVLHLHSITLHLLQSS